MAKNKQPSEQSPEDREFASRSAEPANEEALEAKREKQAEGGPPVVLASEVNTLTPEAGDDVGEKEVQARVDEEEEWGMRGVKTDPTPNEAYTVKGVTEGQPTPETDPSLRPDIVAASRLDGPPPMR